MTLEHVSDHYDRAYVRLLEQYKDKPRFAALLKSYLDQIQELEDATWDVVEAHYVDTADLTRLKVLGRIVGQVYRGELVEDFRVMVRARIRINRSHGKQVDIIEVAQLLLDGIDLSYEEHYPASILLRVEEEFPAGVSPTLVAELLREAKAAGVGFGMIYALSPAFKFSATSSPGTPTAVGWGTTTGAGVGGALAAII
jgi:hypothetical protein